MTLSGIANANSTTNEIMVLADDHKGGVATQTFMLYVQILPSELSNYLALIIVSLLLAAFIIITVIVLCRKNMKCKKKQTQENNSDDDSFEEDDDICVEDAKPKNPFTFKK